MEHSRAFIGLLGWSVDGEEERGGSSSSSSNDDRTMYYNSSGAYYWPSSILPQTSLDNDVNVLDSFIKEEPHSPHSRLLRPLDSISCPTLETKQLYDTKR